MAKLLRHLLRHSNGKWHCSQILGAKPFFVLATRGAFGTPSVFRCSGLGQSENVVSVVDKTATMDFVCTGAIFEWRGPAPYYYLAVPSDLCEDLRAQASPASYGWGVVPVMAESGGVAFSTSLFPREGGYLIPLKKAVREKLQVSCGDTLTVSFTVVFPALQR